MIVGKEKVRPTVEPTAGGMSVRTIALIVGLIYYAGALIIFRHVITAIPSVLRGESVIAGDELVPFFNPSSQLLEQAAGKFNELTNGYEFRVRYAFLTTWVRYYKVLPFAILIVIPSIFWVVYLTVARFMDRVFTTLSSQAIYLATAFPVALIYLIMVYAKVTHFYTLLLGLGMFTVSSLWMLYALLFERIKWRRYVVLSSVVTLLNPAIHYLILFSLFFVFTVVTLFLGEVARWIRLAGPRRVRRVPRTLRRLATSPVRLRMLRYLWHRWTRSVMGRCVSAGTIFAVVTLIPYGLFVKYVALRGVPNLSETVPGDYYFIKDASVSWLHVISWDLAGITDKLLFGDYLAKVPRYPNIAYTLLLLVPLVVPPVTRRLFPIRPHRQLLGVIYVQMVFAMWATFGYSEPIWLPTFHRALAGLTRAATATQSPVGSLTLTITSTIVQVLRFPHRFQLILFMLAPLVMTLTLAVGIDTLSARWTARYARGPRAERDRLFIRLAATVWVASVFFTPFLANAPYRTVFSSGDLSGFLSDYPVADLRQLKNALEALPDGKTVVLPPTETAKLVVDDNGVDHKFIDKFYIYYLDKPSFYYGLTGDIKNKFEFFLILRGIYYQQDWWVNEARNIGLRYIVVNRKLRDNRGVGAEYLPHVEDYTDPDIKQLPSYLKLRFQNKSYSLYELVDQPQPVRQTLLIDSSWSSYLKLVFTRLDLSRCYDFQYLPYYEPPPADKRKPMLVTTDDKRTAALDLYMLDHPKLIAKPDSKIFAFNPDIIASSYYLSPMFRSFLFFSNTKWNRTEIITPGVFGTLRGSFIGLPRATRFDAPVTITQPGRYHLLMRTAATANTVDITAPALGYDHSFELRSPPQDLQMFDVDKVYTPDRVPVDTAAQSVAQLEQKIPDQLVPVNLAFAYQDLGTVDATAGPHTFSIDKTDTDPMLFEGLMLVPEAEYQHLTLPPEATVVDNPNTLKCSEQTPVRPADSVIHEPAANAAHPDLSQEQLLDLAASGVEDIVPDASGGLGSTWLSLGTTTLLLIGSGLVIRWRARRRPDEDERPDRTQPPPDGT